MSIDESGFIYIYNFNLRTHKYEKYQEIAVDDGSNFTYAGTITDDHQQIVFGNTNGKVYVYQFNETQFSISQVIDVTGEVSSVGLTNDHEMLAVSSASYVFIYKHNGSQFNLNQTIALGS